MLTNLGTRRSLRLFGMRRLLWKWRIRLLEMLLSVVDGWLWDYSSSSFPLALFNSKSVLIVHLLTIADGLQKKENGKRRKEDHSSRKSKDKRVWCTDHRLAFGSSIMMHFTSLHLLISLFFTYRFWQEKTTDTSAKSSSHLNVHPNGPAYASPMMPLDADDGISFKGLICSRILFFFFFFVLRL